MAKSLWGRRKVEYLGHQISLAGLEANPKDLGSLVNIPFPRTLRAMQSILGSLNYYSRFIEDFAVYASVLYELREADFHEINRVSNAPKRTSAVRPDAIHDGSAGAIVICTQNRRSMSIGTQLQGTIAIPRAGIDGRRQ